MTKINLPYVNALQDRTGRVTYFYFRRGGRRWRLPPLGDQPSEEFMAEYARLLAATEPPTPTKSTDPLPGSFGALVAEYLSSKEEFGEKKPNTQRIYRMILEPLAEIHANKPVALLERRHVKAWRDARAATPGMANMVVRVVRVLLNYAVDNEWCRENPVKRLKLFKLGEHRAWSDAECTAFESRWPAASMQRRAYMLAKYTGQRCIDIAGMTRAHRKDGFIRVVQQKTGTELWVYEHRNLTKELATGGGHMSLLTRANGSAFDSNSLGIWFADAIDKAGLPDDCVMHGLRKTAARMLAEVGCSTPLIASITGHRSLKQLQDYISGADQKRMSKAAILKLEQNEKGTQSGKHNPRRSGKQKPTG
jgi:integrase